MVFSCAFVSSMIIGFASFNQNVFIALSRRQLKPVRERLKFKRNQ